MVSLGLEDKVVLVTGGNRGIGAAIVALLGKTEHPKSRALGRFEAVDSINFDGSTKVFGRAVRCT